jgi:hypothetical protein
MVSAVMVGQAGHFFQAAECIAAVIPIAMELEAA